jgi:hypothetical protein
MIGCITLVAGGNLDLSAKKKENRSGSRASKRIPPIFVAHVMVGTAVCMEDG